MPAGQRRADIVALAPRPPAIERMSFDHRQTGCWTTGAMISWPTKTDPPQRQAGAPTRRAGRRSWGQIGTPTQGGTDQPGESRRRAARSRCSWRTRQPDHGPRSFVTERSRVTGKPNPRSDLRCDHSGPSSTTSTGHAPPQSGRRGVDPSLARRGWIDIPGFGPVPPASPRGGRDLRPAFAWSRLPPRRTRRSCNGNGASSGAPPWSSRRADRLDRGQRHRWACRKDRREEDACDRTARAVTVSAAALVHPLVLGGAACRSIRSPAAGSASGPRRPTAGA